MGIFMETPPQNTGQIVETSFGWHDGHLYMRVIDKSENTESWYMADDDESAEITESWEPIDGDPGISSWEQCEKPGAESLQEAEVDSSRLLQGIKEDSVDHEKLMLISRIMAAGMTFADLLDLSRACKTKRDAQGSIQNIMSRYPDIAYRAHRSNGGWAIHLMIGGSEIAIT